MAGFLFIKRIVADTETRSHPIAPHRFADRNVFGNFTIIFQVIRDFKNAGDFIVNVLILQFGSRNRNKRAADRILLFAVGKRVKIKTAFFQRNVDLTESAFDFIDLAGGNGFNTIKDFKLSRFNLFDRIFQLAQLFAQFVTLGSGNIPLQQSFVKGHLFIELFIVNPIFFSRNLFDFVFDRHSLALIFIQFLTGLGPFFIQRSKDGINVFVNGDKIAHQVSVSVPRFDQFLIFVRNYAVRLII